MDPARADYSASPVSVLAHYAMRVLYVLLSDSPVFDIYHTGILKIRSYTAVLADLIRHLDTYS